MLTDSHKLRVEMEAERQMHREQIEQLQSGQYDLDTYLALIGIDPQRVRKAIRAAAPVTYGQCRAMAAGFIAGFASSSFGEIQISEIARLAYDELPWRISTEIAA